MGVIPSKKVLNLRTAKKYRKEIYKTREPIIITSHDLHFLCANESALSMIGLSKVENLNDYYFFDFLPNTQPHMEMVSAQAFNMLIVAYVESTKDSPKLEISEFDFQLKKISGEFFWVHIWITLFIVNRTNIFKFTFEPKDEVDVFKFEKSKKSLYSQFSTVVTESGDFSPSESMPNVTILSQNQEEFSDYSFSATPFDSVLYSNQFIENSVFPFEKSSFLDLKEMDLLSQVNNKIFELKSLIRKGSIDQMITLIPLINNLKDSFRKIYHQKEEEADEICKDIFLIREKEFLRRSEIEALWIELLEILTKKKAEETEKEKLKAKKMD